MKDGDALDELLASAPVEKPKRRRLTAKARAAQHPRSGRAHLGDVTSMPGNGKIGCLWVFRGWVRGPFWATGLSPTMQVGQTHLPRTNGQRSVGSSSCLAPRSHRVPMVRGPEGWVPPGRPKGEGPRSRTPHRRRWCCSRQRHNRRLR
jgi:hypothetical protein